MKTGSFALTTLSALLVLSIGACAPQVSGPVRVDADSVAEQEVVLSESVGASGELRDVAVANDVGLKTRKQLEVDAAAPSRSREEKRIQPPVRQPTVLARTRSPTVAQSRAVISSVPAAPSVVPSLQNILDGENYGEIRDNPVVRVAEQPVSTFSIDVDTGAYSNVRRLLKSGQLPPNDAVRVEELINYFDYAYEDGRAQNRPFSITTEVGPAPWNPEKKLVHVGIKGVDVSAQETPSANLVFLVDVSGSMKSADKLELLKSSLKLLVSRMGIGDRISLVVYAGASGVVLEPVPGDQRFRIHQALDSLSAGGSTNGGAGIRLAYKLAEDAWIEGGINRILLATDGDFNVGTTNFDSLVQLVKQKRKSGISLTTLGFGRGNYNDHLMEQLADAGNGNYAYIDTLNEAQKVLVDEISSTLNIVASDVKIQIEFNPALVSEYRLIGYENRLLNREDFNNDKVDAGEIGAGHTVTALYEISLVGGRDQAIDPLRYTKVDAADRYSNELALLRLRYKGPRGGASSLIEQPLYLAQMSPDLVATTTRYRFSAAVAAFGQQLRGGTWMGQFGYDQILELARNARGEDAFGYRGEFLGLVNLARSLDGD